MHPIFSVTLFTGQQLVLEAIQRWLQRPCADAESQRQRRLGLKGLISLLIRTAATGVLATVLDAAIEFRRRQLLAAASAEPGDAQDAAAGGSRFPGLGMLSRAGIASWKARLLLCVDELERRAEAFGIESRYRFSPGKPGGENEAAAGSSKAPALPRQHASCLELSDEEQSQRLGRTVEQLRELVKQGDAESQRRLDDEVGSLVDLLLGTASLPSSPSAAYTAAASAAAAGNRCRSVPAALDRMGGRQEAASGGMRASRSRAALAGPGVADESSSGCEVCQICMDRLVNVQVADCRHDLCFSCARRLCSSQDHLVPQCPFCRQAINGFVGIGGRTCASGAGAASGNGGPAATVRA